MATALLNPLRLANFNYRSRISRVEGLWPLFLPYSFWNHFKVHYHGYDADYGYVTPSVQLVIDGFQGSANSFAVKAFRLGQRQPVRLAHHMHSPAQMMKAIKLGIPVVLTIRDPEASVLSLSRRWPYISISAGLIHYTQFYQSLLPYRDRYIVSPFAQTTQHFDQIIQQVNHRFGTHFDLIDPAQAHQEIYGSAETIQDVSRNLAEKRKKQLDFYLEQNKMLLQAANQVYNQLLN